jgi:hypothetical protein
MPFAFRKYRPDTLNADCSQGEGGSMTPSPLSFLRVHQRVMATRPAEVEPGPLPSWADRLLVMLPLVCTISLSELVALVVIILPWGE